MSDDQQPPPQPTPPRARRSSLADLFSTARPTLSKPADTSTSPSNMPGPISQAAAQAQRRRMSLTTLGLSGSPNQTSPFGSYRGRHDSIGSANSGSIDESAESAIAEDDGSARDATPTTPFARRTSFGARALRDIRTASFGGGSSGGGGPGSPGQNGTKSPPASSVVGPPLRSAQNGLSSSRDSKGREGFNWSDNFRDRAARTSIAGSPNNSSPPMAGHSRAKSIATPMEAPPAAQIPKPKEPRKPDPFQERILKGDFYMD